MDLYRVFGKPLFDTIVSILSLLLLGPLMLLLALLIRWTMGAPILFRQTRPGLSQRPFTLLKFRTMTEMRDASGCLLPDAARLTPLGRFLRSTSLDELPQFINVLRGEMSIVGPRPLLMEYLPLYSPEQARRHAVRPGITGWAQVNGRNALTWEARFDCDLWYIDHLGFWLDLRILALTALKVLRREGILQADGAAVERFQGTPPSLLERAAPAEEQR